MAGYLVQFPNGQYGWRRRGLRGYKFLYLRDAEKYIETWLAAHTTSLCSADTAFYVLQCAANVAADQPWYIRRLALFKAKRAMLGTRVWK